jgi:crotonobetainyl-CoA:carnitine CoA-transferase CaiB-like acyl-CoA transferase
MSDGAASPAALPLTGVRVLDVSRFVSGPLCSFHLASMGAEVIAVERPGGEQSRRLPPFATADGGVSGSPVEGGLSVPYLKRGRGKRSVAIALDTPDGRALARALAARSDVFLENSRPGTMASWGLAPARLRAEQPRLVYCSISGYGQSGPRRDGAAMDVVVQALSGLMAKTGFPDGPPLRAGATVADVLTAAFAALGIVAALRQRDTTGEGQHVDVAMLDALTSLVWDEPVDVYASQGLPVRTGNADPRGAPINAYRTLDGWVAVTLTSDAQWAALAPVIGRPAWVTEMPTIRERAAHAAEIDAAIDEWSGRLTTDAVEQAFTDCGVPAGRVRDPVAVRDDPHVVARGVLEVLRHPASPPGVDSGLRGPRLPIAFSGRAASLPPAEPLGASTEAVLVEVLGLDRGEVAALRDRGVVG